MERSNALYFPSISIPENKWTIKTLLYWDKLAAIVPLNHIEEPVHVPALSDHPFRFNPITDFGLIRSPISEPPVSG